MLKGQLRRFLSDHSGATALEYCMIASLVAMAIVGGVTSIGGSVRGYLAKIAAVN